MANPALSEAQRSRSLTMIVSLFDRVILLSDSIICIYLFTSVKVLLPMEEPSNVTKVELSRNKLVPCWEREHSQREGGHCRKALLDFKTQKKYKKRHLRQCIQSIRRSNHRQVCALIQISMNKDLGLDIHWLTLITGAVEMKSNYFPTWQCLP